MASPLAFILVSMTLGCGTECGEGTHKQDGICLPDRVESTEGDTSDTGDTASDDTGDDEIDSVEPPADPGYPDFPEEILTLTVTMRASPSMLDESGVASVCLTDTRCFELTLADVDEFDADQLGVYHFEAVGLSRADVDRFELVKTIPSNLSPTCMQVAFDGEPVHCRRSDGDPSSLWDESDLVPCTTCNDEVITLGPILGMAKAENTRIWVRTDATRPVELHLGSTPEDMRLVSWAYPRVEDDFTAEFVLEDLMPSTDYVYQLKVDGEAVGDVYPFTTAPLDDSSVELEFAFFSCSSRDAQPAFASIADGDPDLIAFLGDNHYGNTGDKGSLQWNYRWAHSRTHRKELMQVTPTLAIWDDHDYLGNNTTGSTPGKVAARMVFEDYWPNPAHGTDELPGVFFATSYGDVDFFFLDGRYYRGDNDNLIGDSQMMWLMEELLSSTATFKLIVGGSQWSFESSVDSWAVFPEARTRLFDFIADQAIDGVGLLSGDVHYSEVRRIEHPGLYSIPEFTSSGVATNHLPCRESETEQVICYDEGNSYMTLSIDTVSLTPSIAAAIHNSDGTVVGDHTVWLAELQL